MLIERISSLDAAREVRVDALHGTEEFTLDATVDERTADFNLGRTAFVFLGEPGASRPSPTQLAAAVRACEAAPERRFATVADLATAWRA